LVPATGYTAPTDVYDVEGDASSASYFLAAGAVGGGPVRVQGVGRDSIQGDLRFLDVLQACGAELRYESGSVEVRSAKRVLRAFDLDLNHIPDAAMTAAMLGLFADGPCTVRNVASWRVKETDRLAAMASELRKFDVAVETGADWIRVSPPRRRLPEEVAVDTYDDHRVAMCFSLVALAGVAVRIRDPECVAKTYPGYFSDLAAILDRR
jgi:3-phosphoshikimate 1-carboxyvinyltransferase